MKTSAMLLLAFLALPLLAAEPLDYELELVRRTVIVKSAAGETRAANGTHARGGDRVETGWFSSARIVSKTSAARFDIFSATEVTLAGDTPGVILSLERGKIRAMFDKITGSEPRIVKTPGALLAVRGTDFDIEVDRDGNTIVDVHEGLVEVQSPLRPEPLFVRPGEQARFGRNRAPAVRPMPENRRRDGEGNRDPRAREGDRPGGRDGATPRDGGRRGGGGMSPQQPPQQPPPQPPPHRPPQSESI
jgi:hypothetical protein